MYSITEGDQKDPDFKHPIQIALVNLTEAIASLADMLNRTNGAQEYKVTLDSLNPPVSTDNTDGPK